MLPYAELPQPPGAELHNMLELDGRALAWTRRHGQAIIWFALYVGRIPTCTA
jgi:hypothetical protein